MSNSYQAIYDAVRLQFMGTDANRAVTDAITGAIDLSTINIQFLKAIEHVEGQMSRPSVLYRPSIGRDGNMWCALYGENLAEGVAGFGESPELAMLDFDQAWFKKVSRS